MDLRTTYLGFELPHPLIAGASPMVDDLDLVRRLEDAGVAAIVMHSLFEEQITREQWGTILDMELHSANSAEATSYFPQPAEFRLGPENYLDQIRRIKEAVGVPLIASLNGVTPSGWLDYARLIEQAGADGLELNVYYLATSVEETGAQVEKRTLDMLKTVKSSVKIPVAVKLSAQHTALPHLAAGLAAGGADALVLFNRFFQPDIDLEHLEALPSLRLSDSGELLLRLRWLAILHGQVNVPLAVTGGVHTAMDALKSVMAGASAVQVVSTLLQHGPERLNILREGMIHWMEEHEYTSLRQMLGSMSLRKCPSPLAFTRANYMRILQGWKP
ncbi:MAG: dihydroorotate dehydrogenase-like protein [Acidobacteria bacterium]|nr:dihydroorotate dehydrogenase-like protein [Acidobacteriota bacterium]